jgi:hypothetical protein
MCMHVVRAVSLHSPFTAPNTTTKGKRWEIVLAEVYKVDRQSTETLQSLKKRVAELVLWHKVSLFFSRLTYDLCLLSYRIRAGRRRGRLPPPFTSTTRSRIATSANTLLRYWTASHRRSSRLARPRGKGLLERYVIYVSFILFYTLLIYLHLQADRARKAGLVLREAMVMKHMP